MDNCNNSYKNLQRLDKDIKQTNLLVNNDINVIKSDIHKYNKLRSHLKLCVKEIIKVENK